MSSRHEKKLFVVWDISKLLLEDDSGQELVEVYRRDLGKEFRLLRHQDDGIERILLMRIPTALLRKDSGEINQVVDGRFRGEG